MVGDLAEAVAVAAWDGIQQGDRRDDQTRIRGRRLSLRRARSFTYTIATRRVHKWCDDEPSSAVTDTSFQY